MPPLSSLEPDHLSAGLERIQRYFHRHPAGRRDCIAGRFEVLDEMGRGGFGIVYRARDLPPLDTLVAVKLVRPERLAPASGAGRYPPQFFLRLFEKEAYLTRHLRHHQLVTVIHVGTWERPGLPALPYMAMDLLQGQTLEQRLRHGPLPEAEAVEILSQMLHVLDFIHGQGVLHLDVKPSNLFLEEDGHLRLLDLGLARVMDAPSDAPEFIHYALSHAATHQYLPPEQLRSSQRDAGTDLYAAALCFLELRAVRPGTRRAVRLLAGMNPALRAVLLAALHADPRKRFTSAGAFRSALLNAVAQLRAEEQGLVAPYRHLEPFEREHAGTFFGRERSVRVILDRLRQEPILALIGASGAGKSSLLRAGVLPALGERWHALLLSPGATPLPLLQRLIAPFVADGERTLLAQPDYLSKEPLQLGTLLRRYARSTGKRLLLLLDPFEECYGQAADIDQRRALAQALLGAADDPQGDVRVLLALREDFLSRLGETPALFRAVADHHLLLGPPEREDLCTALCRPAERRGFSYEGGLADEILAELSEQETPLPLLQLLAYRLWEHRDEQRRLLRKSTLRQLGGVGGVLAAHADGVIALLGDERRRFLGKEILCHLTSPEGTRRALGRAALLGALPEGAAGVLEALIQGRLLAERRESLEIIHDALITHWGALQTWLAEEPAARALRQQLYQDARAYQEHQRPTRYLWRGAALELMERFAQQHPDALEPAQVRLLLDSRAAVGRRGKLRAGGVLLVILILSLVSLSLLHLRSQALQAAKKAQVALQRAEGERADKESALADKVSALADKESALRTEAQARQDAERAAAMAQAAGERAKADREKAQVAAQEAKEGQSMAERASRREQDARRQAEAARRQAEDMAQQVAAEVKEKEQARAESLRGIQQARQQIKEGSMRSALAALLPPLLAALPHGLEGGQRRLLLRALSGLREATQTEVLGRTLYRYAGEVRAMAVVGHLLASADERGDVRLWRSDGSPLRRWQGPGPVSSMTFAPDGVHLAAGGVRGQLRLWQVATGEQKDLGPFGASWLSVLVFLDRQRILVAGANTAPRVVSLSGPSQPLKLTQALSGLDAAAAGRRTLLLAPVLGPPLLQKDDQPWRLLIELQADRVHLSPQEDEALLLTREQAIRAPLTQGPMTESRVMPAALAAAYAPSGQRLALALRLTPGKVCLWELDEGSEEGCFQEPAPIKDLAFVSADLLWLGRADGAVRLIALDDQSLLRAACTALGSATGPGAPPAGCER